MSRRFHIYLICIVQNIEDLLEVQTMRCYGSFILANLEKWISLRVKMWYLHKYCSLWYAVKSFLPKEISQQWSLLVAKAQSKSWCNSQSLEQVTFDQQFINVSEKFAFAFKSLALKAKWTLISTSSSTEERDQSSRLWSQWDIRFVQSFHSLTMWKSSNQKLFRETPGKLLVGQLMPTYSAWSINEQKIFLL